jgi:hypothetical protein
MAVLGSWWNSPVQARGQAEGTYQPCRSMPSRWFLHRGEVQNTGGGIRSLPLKELVLTDRQVKECTESLDCMADAGELFEEIDNVIGAIRGAIKDISN